MIESPPRHRMEETSSQRTPADQPVGDAEPVRLQPRASKPTTDPTPPNPSVEPISHRPTGDRRLPRLTPSESLGGRVAFLATAILIALGYFWVTQAYWAPAHPGIDQNGYLVGGRLFAKTLSTGYQPTNPFQYIGGMWVMTESGWVYPKYPLGIPILTAICFWIGGDAHGPLLTYYVSPVSAALAVLGMFFLARPIVGSFGAVMAQLLLATNPVMLQMTNNPWSHAPAVAFVVWGMTFLLGWWRYDGLWRAAIAGFLLGFAVLIRYTEALLLIPMAVVCLSKLRWGEARSWVRTATPVLAWSAPVLYLLAFNKLAMGTWTGYDTTNESTGFDAAKLIDKWRGTLDALYGVAAYFVLPMGLLGMLLLFRFSWRVGLLLAGWFIPGVILYTAYYWGGGNMPRMGYMRFFLTLLPPLFIASVWLMWAAAGALTVAGGEARRFSRWFGGAVTPVAIGAVIAVAGSLSLLDSIPELEREMTSTTNLADTTAVVKLHTRGDRPQDVVLFSEGAGGIMNMVNHLQFATGFETYLLSSFSQTNQPWMRRRGNDGDGPNPIQPQLRDWLRERYAKYSDAELIGEQNKLVTEALARGRRVLVLAPDTQADGFVRRYVPETAGFRAEVLASWNEPVKIPQQATRDRRPDGAPAAAGPGGPGGPPGVRPGDPRRDRPMQWPNNSNTARPMRLLELKRK